MRLLIRLSALFFFSVSVCAAQEITFRKCLSGDCENGVGVCRYEVGTNTVFRYIGDFKNGKFDGIGVVYEEAGINTKISLPVYDIPTYVGHFVEDVRVENRSVTTASNSYWVIKCLEGSCKEGEGAALLVYPNQYQLKGTLSHKPYTQGIYKGYFRNGRPRTGSIFTFYGATIGGDFSRGLNGDFYSRIDGKSIPVILREGRCATNTGEPCPDLFEKERARRVGEAAKKQVANVKLPDPKWEIYGVERVSYRPEIPAFQEYDHVYIQVVDQSAPQRPKTVEITHGTHTMNYEFKDKMTIRHENKDKTAEKIFFKFNRTEKYQITVYAPEGVAPPNTEQLEIAERISKNLVPQLESKYGYSHIETQYLPIGELPVTIDRQLFGGNEYGVLAISSATDAVTLNMALKRKTMGLSGQKAKVINGTVRDNGITEINPDLTKMSGAFPFTLDLSASRGGDSGAVVALIYIYKSKDNATSSSQNNKEEDHYAKQTEFVNPFLELVDDPDKHK